MARVRAPSALNAAIGLALVALAGRTTVALWRFATTAPELPLWDEAKYGLDGARLAAALTNLDLFRYAKLVYGLDVWPPLFPVMESVVFLAFGNQVGVARGLVAVLSLLLAVATYWAGRELAPQSPAVAALAAALVLSSPFVHLFAAQAMLELPGALCYVLCVALYARFLRTGERAALIATGLLTTALFFTKYNYALLWLAPLILNEVLIACGGPRAVLSRAIALLRRFNLRRPFTAFVSIYGAALASIVVTGGGTLRLGGAEVGLRSIGNPLLLLVVILLARAVWRPRRAWARWNAWERALSDRYRVLLWTVAAPIAIWLVLPPHLRHFVDFVQNRSSGPPLASAAGVLFYPRAFVEAYHGAPLVGIAVLAMALLALGWTGRAAPAERALLLAVAVGLAATTLHPYKEPRFFFVASTLLWLAGSWRVVTLAEAVLERLRIPRLATNAALAMAVLTVAARAPAAAPGLPDAFARHTAAASTAAVVDRVVELAAARPTLVLGTWNQLSPALVEWRFLGRGTSKTPPELVVPSRGGGSAERVLRGMRDGTGAPQIVVTGISGDGAPSAEWAAAFTAETAWLAPVRRELESGALGYSLVSTETFPGTAYRLLVYRAPSSAPE